MGNGRRDEKSHHALVLSWIFETAIHIYICVISPNWTSHVILWAIGSFGVSLKSLFWVSKRLDFQGRFTARLLCYLMHSIQLAIPWRYLKLTLAFEKGDLVEFRDLRLFQLGLGALPLTLFHSITLCSLDGLDEEKLTLFLLLSSEVFSISLGLLLSSSQLENYFYVSPSLVLNVLSKGLLLVGRVILVGLLALSLGHWYWIVLAVAFHFLFTSFWALYSERDFDFPALLRLFAVNYFLFFDVSFARVELSTVGPITLALLESVAPLILLRKTGGDEKFGFQYTVWNLRAIGGISLAVGLLLQSLIGKWRKKGSEKKSEFTDLETSTSHSNESRQDETEEKEKEEIKPEAPSTQVSFVNEEEKQISSEDSQCQTQFYLEPNFVYPKSTKINSMSPKVRKLSTLRKKRCSSAPIPPDDQKKMRLSKDYDSFSYYSCTLSQDGESRIILNYPKHEHKSERCSLENEPRGSKDENQNHSKPSTMRNGRVNKEIQTEVVMRRPHTNDRHPEIQPVKRKTSPDGTRERSGRDVSVSRVKCDVEKEEEKRKGHDFGILIYESPEVCPKLRVLCARCLEGHDPLLSTCNLASETTDYPSETEGTHYESQSSHDESQESQIYGRNWNIISKYWGNYRPNNPNFNFNINGMEYVKIWLLASNLIPRPPSPPPLSFQPPPKRKIHPRVPYTHTHDVRYHNDNTHYPKDLEIRV